MLDKLRTFHWLSYHSFSANGFSWTRFVQRNLVFTLKTLVSGSTFLSRNSHVGLGKSILGSIIKISLFCEFLPSMISGYILFAQTCLLMIIDNFWLKWSRTGKLTRLLSSPWKNVAWRGGELLHSVMSRFVSSWHGPSLTFTEVYSLHLTIIDLNREWIPFHGKN